MFKIDWDSFKLSVSVCIGFGSLDYFIYFIKLVSIILLMAFFIILLVSMLLVLMAFLLFLILVTYIISLFSWLIWPEVWFYWYFKWISLGFVNFIFCCSSFKLHWFMPKILDISFFLIILYLIYSSFSNFPGLKFRLLILGYSSFLIYSLNSTNFSLNTIFIISHIFWQVVFPFSPSST